MIITDIQTGLFNKFLQPVIDGIAVQIQLLGNPAGIQTGADKRFSRRHRFKADIVEIMLSQSGQLWFMVQIG